MDEIELKFLNIDEDALRARLEENGAVLEYEGEIHTTTFMGNGFSDGDSTQNYLRVRTTPLGTKVTFKGPAKDGDAHIREETEVNVDDHERAVELLKRLGFTDRLQTHRRRAHYTFGECAIEIDDWRIIPAFAEIEAPSEEKLKECARDLGFDYAKGCRGTVAELYPDIFEG